jgi:hypothetical protein
MIIYHTIQKIKLGKVYFKGEVFRRRPPDLKDGDPRVDEQRIEEVLQGIKSEPSATSMRDSLSGPGKR